MKNVIYYGDRKYLLTNKEFQEAIKVWKTKNSYFCSRLETLMSEKYIVVETPSEDLGYEVFLTKGQLGGIKKIFKKGEKYFQQTSSDFGGGKKSEIKLSPKQILGLISQEKYYGEQKMLTD